MNIPNALLSQIREGKAVLFLGSGASRNAKLLNCKDAPLGADLGLMLAEKFLDKTYGSLPLNQVSEYAISETDLTTVQGYVREVFLPLVPTLAHRAITGLLWHGIATTNYDLLIEEAYQDQKATALQIPVPLIEDADRVDDLLRNPRSVALVKLHGCITRIANGKCPLILTTEQYVEHKHGRSRIFNVFKDWAYEHPIIFIGYSLQDADIRAILLELTSLGEKRPRYYVVSPGNDDIKARFWEQKKVTVLHGTFDEFMIELDRAIPKPFRELGLIRAEIQHPIEKHFRIANPTYSKALLQFLETDVDYVGNTLKTEQLDATQFYRGVDPGFAAIEQGLDVKRRLCDDILSDYFLRGETDDLPAGVELILLKAHAGAGKSVLLRRMAWEASAFGCICLFVKSYGVVTASALQELVGLCGDRIYLFVDDAADRVRELQQLVKTMGPEGKFLTVILAERINEWNVQGVNLVPFIESEYELKYMNEKEIASLLGLLERNKSLGTLERLSKEDRIEALAERAGRQLLVALHEATLGEPFVKILLDEYNHIVPAEAQHVYLTICVLNRLAVPVRAGIVARIHGIPFEEFKQRLFQPLEHVVFSQYDPVIRDYVYKARHPYIADLVFRNVLAKPEERFEAYLRCLKALNIAYTADRTAFWKMMRSRTLLDLFANQQMIIQLFDAAREIVGEDAHLLHQMALYEMRKEGASLSESSKLPARAAVLAPYDLTIKHSLAELKLKAADESRSPLERSRLLNEAQVMSNALKNTEKTASHHYHTLVKIGLRKLEESIEANDGELEIQKLVKKVEEDLFDALQRFPGDPYILETESQLGLLLHNNERALAALEKAFLANPRSSFIALRLSAIFERKTEDAALDQANTAKARNVLEKALNANNSECRLHYAFSKLLLNEEFPNAAELEYHLARSFNQGDSNFDAQLLYARQLFLNGHSQRSRDMFKELAKARVAPNTRHKIQYEVSALTCTGRIVRKEAFWGFVAREGDAAWIYMDTKNLEGLEWDDLTKGDRLTFGIGFTLKGPTATNIRAV